MYDEPPSSNVSVIFNLLRYSQACDSARCDFSVQRMQRRALRPDDIAIDIKFCGRGLHSSTFQLTRSRFGF